MRRQAIWPVALVLLVAACSNARLNYVTTERSFKAAVEFAAGQRRAGVMDDDTYRKLDPAVQGGNSALKLWLAILIETEPGQKPNVSQAIYTAILDAIDILEAYMIHNGGS